MSTFLIKIKSPVLIRCLEQNLIVKFDRKRFSFNDAFRRRLFLLFRQFVDQMSDLDWIFDENCFFVFVFVLKEEVDLRDVATRVARVAFSGDRHLDSKKKFRNLEKKIIYKTQKCCKSLSQ